MESVEEIEKLLKRLNKAYNTLDSFKYAELLEKLGSNSTVEKFDTLYKELTGEDYED